MVLVRHGELDGPDDIARAAFAVGVQDLEAVQLHVRRHAAELAHRRAGRVGDQGRDVRPVPVVIVGGGRHRGVALREVVEAMDPPEVLLVELEPRVDHRHPDVALPIEHGELIVEPEGGQHQVRVDDPEAREVDCVGARLRSKWRPEVGPVVVVDGAGGRGVRVLVLALGFALALAGGPDDRIGRDAHHVGMRGQPGQVVTVNDGAQGADRCMVALDHIAVRLELGLQGLAPTRLGRDDHALGLRLVVGDLGP